MGDPLWVIKSLSDKLYFKLSSKSVIFRKNPNLQDFDYFDDFF